MSSENLHQHIQSVEKAFAVFEFLCRCDNPMRIAEISRSLKMNKTTVFRILQTFKSLGYVEQERDTDRYLPTLKVAGFSNMILNRVELRSIARDVLRELSLEVQESVHLSIRDKDEVVIIDKIEGPTSARISFHIGRRSPMHTTGTGKIMLSDLPDDTISEYINRTTFTAKTPNTITTGEALFEEIRIIRKNGFAHDRAENDPEISCVAAPVRDYSGKVVAGMSIVGATPRISAIRDELAPRIVRAAGIISARMGFSQHV